VKGSAECVVWWVPLDSARPALQDLLDAVELRRLHQFRRPTDRSRFLLGAALLRLAVEQRTGSPASQVVIDRACARCGCQHGRTRLPGTALRSSVSHAGDWVGVALTGVGEVGLDVEKERRVDVHSLALEILAPGEVLHEQRDFFVYWTRKEAVLKATGDGLYVPMSQIRVGPPQAAPVVGAYPGAPELAIRLYDLAGRNHPVAALAVLTGAPVEVRERDGTSLLTSAFRR
jgi:4'-phosphopantetheinyl transferase